MTQVQLTIPVSDGRLQLGVWQGIFLVGHRGSLVLTLLGEWTSGRPHGNLHLSLLAGKKRVSAPASCLITVKSTKYIKGFNKVEPSWPAAEL